MNPATRIILASPQRLVFFSNQYLSTARLLSHEFLPLAQDDSAFHSWVSVCVN